MEEAFVVAIIKLYIKGIGYGGAASGAGSEVEASTMYYGDYTEQVYYRIAKRSGVLDKLLHRDESGWGVATAYLKRSTFDDVKSVASVERDAVERAGMADYILYSK